MPSIPIEIEILLLLRQLLRTVSILKELLGEEAMRHPDTYLIGSGITLIYAGAAAGAFALSEHFGMTHITRSSLKRR